MAGERSGARLAMATGLALVAFAANSLLCRGALASRSIDPASFTLVRLASGAVVLGVLASAGGRARKPAGDLASAVALFVYAIAFSIAYTKLPTGSGALVLFGCVQVTMLLAAVRGGERLRPSQWMAFLVAAGGLVALV